MTVALMVERVDSLGERLSEHGASKHTAALSQGAASRQEVNLDPSSCCCQPPRRQTAALTSSSTLKPMFYMLCLSGVTLQRRGDKQSKQSARWPYCFNPDAE